MDQHSTKLDEKISKSNEIIQTAYSELAIEKMALAWTGGKDSTLLLWLTLQLANKNGHPLPQFLFINEGNVFEEVKEFVKYLSSEWELTYEEIINKDVISQVSDIGEPVLVSRLNERNREELQKLGFVDESFPFEPESYVGNHLMKTVAMNVWIEENEIEAIVTGIRRDEQDARKYEEYFSPREDPDHMRIHPILHFTERDVWDVIQTHQIPFLNLYEQGYRSLGAAHTTTKSSNLPAWEQDLENTSERAGRRQDKEGIMAKLRALGYM